MTYGPIDFIALEFPGNRFRGEILPELFELVDQAALVGVLNSLYDMGYPLLKVERLGPSASAEP